MPISTAPSRSLDLDALDPLRIAPAQYYALCREADQRGIPVALDDPDSPTTVEGLIALVRHHRAEHALVEALRDALAGVGITAPDWIDEVGVGNRWEEWTGVHVALAMHVEETGTAESGPSVSFYPTQWVNVIEGEDGAGYMFVFCSTSESHDDGDTPQHEVLVPSTDPTVVAATLVGILRAAGYESLS